MFFYIYDDCKIVSGHNKCLIYDLTRNKLFNVPLEISQLKPFNKKELCEIPKEFDDYVQFLITHEFATILPKELKNSFQNIEELNKDSILIEDFISFSHIEDNYDWFIKALPVFGCENATIMCGIVDENKLLNYIGKFIDAGFSRIDLLFPSKSTYHEIVETISSVGSIVIYKSPQKKYTTSSSGKTIVYKKEVIEEAIISHNKSKIHSDFFMVNLKNYLSLQQENGYFNRKIILDSKMNIKNAIESHDILGNLMEMDIKALTDLIHSTKFNKYRLATKEKFIDCKVCEYRYCCNDNRLPYINTGKEWSHKIECNYNPYINKWKNEDGHISVKQYFDNINLNKN